MNPARYLVLFLRRSGGQAQFSTPPRAEFSGATSMRELQLWCRENIAQDLSVSVLAGPSDYRKRFRAGAGSAAGVSR